MGILLYSEILYSLVLNLNLRVHGGRLWTIIGPILREAYYSYDAGPRQEIFTPGLSCSRSYFRDFKRINPPDLVFHWNIYIVFRRQSAFQSQKAMSGLEEQVIRYVLKCSWSWTSQKSWEINLDTRKYKNISYLHRSFALAKITLTSTSVKETLWLSW